MTDEARKKVIMVYVLLILTFFCSTVRAAEECNAGDGESKWTLLIGGTKVHLKGDICGVGGGEWEARNIKGNKVFYSGTYALIGEHSKESKSKSGKRIGWK